MMRCAREAGGSIEAYLGAISQDALALKLNTDGAAVIEGFLTPGECVELAALYLKDAPFRSHVQMAQHGFGKGEYKYFTYPLPEIVQILRTALYPMLAPLANEWNEKMGVATRFPDTHASYVKACHAAGQTKPTPLLLQYVADDYNRLHQDVYGDMLFPLQAAVLLSKPQRDFTGGEFVLTEQRPRMQSRAQVVSLNQGGAVIFAVRERPIRGLRRHYRVNMRHGVSRLTWGRRHTLGVIFHDAA